MTMMMIELYKMRVCVNNRYYCMGVCVFRSVVEEVGCSMIE